MQTVARENGFFDLNSSKNSFFFSLHLLHIATEHLFWLFKTSLYYSLRKNLFSNLFLKPFSKNISRTSFLFLNCAY